MDKLYNNKDIQTNQGEAEKLAKCIIEKKSIDDLYSIKKITRISSYNAKHTGITDSKAKNLTERLLAIKLFNKNFIHIGKVFDYEVPLKNSNTDKGVGKIDLVAKNKNIVTLLELKAKDSKETLLRCVLEIFTYWK